MGKGGKKNLRASALLRVDAEADPLILGEGLIYIDFLRSTRIEK